ncbi:DNA polymerase III subunit gamma/tau [Candidatus Peregrinibacteria bacterium]|nr:DNA polymerase III subunit gamma/tau [Candidatus Peregrinibacteria bacterium]
MSLYREYRPKDFTGLVGQEHVSTTLLNALKAKQTAHAYLFTGPRGTGKTTTARLFAKAVNSDKMTEDGQFDGCEISAEIDEGKLIDIIEIDAASNRGIDEIRELREKINFSPTRVKNKVYIIDEVHMLTKEAFNALLKTLEEPPTFVYFILATTEVHKVPETIISRCQRFDFKRITENDIINRLMFVCENESIKAEKEALGIIAKQAKGGLRDALTMLEQMIVDNGINLEYVKKTLGISESIIADELFQHINDGLTKEAIKTVERIYQQGIDLTVFTRDYLEFLRQKMLTAIEENKTDYAEQIIKQINYFQHAYQQLKNSVIAQLPLEIAIAKSVLITQKKNRLIEADDNVKMQTPNEKSKTIKKSSELKIETKEIIEKTEIEVDNINLNQIVSSWQKIGERIHNPIIRRSLMMATPDHTNGNILNLVFSDNFNKDKLFKADNLAMAEKAIEEVTGYHVSLRGIVDSSRKIINKDDTIDTKPSEGGNAVATALDIFEGDID